MERQPYPSDVSDDEWAFVAPYLTLMTEDAPQREHSLRGPMCGPNDGSGVFTIPERPIRRRLRGLPRFVIIRGGEYCFMPGLRALRCLADLSM